MLKRVLGLIITVVMLLGVLGLAGCESFDLTKYKTEAKAEIEAYATAKGQDNYTFESWEIILQTLADGKVTIDKAMDKAEIDAVVAKTKDEMNWRVSPKFSGLGNFEGLEREIELQIIHAYYDDYEWHEFYQENPIKGYYGIYSDCTVVSFNLGFGWGGMGFGFFTYIIFENKIFFGSIYVWKSSELYSVKEAYEQNLLTMNDLEEISDRSKEFYSNRYDGDDYLQRIES